MSVRRCLDSNIYFLYELKVGSGVHLGLSRTYANNLFGPMFYSWWNCPLKHEGRSCVYSSKVSQINAKFATTEVERNV